MFYPSSLRSTVSTHVRIVEPTDISDSLFLEEVKPRSVIVCQSFHDVRSIRNVRFLLNRYLQYAVDAPQWTFAVFSQTTRPMAFNGLPAIAGHVVSPGAQHELVA